MGKKIGLIIQYIIFLGGGIFLIWWQFNKMTPTEFKEFKFALSNANYLVVIPIVFVGDVEERLVIAHQRRHEIQDDDAQAIQRME